MKVNFNLMPDDKNHGRHEVKFGRVGAYCDPGNVRYAAPLTPICFSTLSANYPLPHRISYALSAGLRRDNFLHVGGCKRPMFPNAADECGSNVEARQAVSQPVSKMLLTRLVQSRTVTGIGCRPSQSDLTVILRICELSFSAWDGSSVR